MSSHYTHHLFLSLPPSLYPSSNYNQPRHVPGFWLFGAKDRRVLPLICNAVSKPRTQDYTDVFQPVIKWHKTPSILGDDTQQDEEAPPSKDDDSATTEIIKEHVESIKSMLSSMEDGEISVSAYDTAWVALVEDVNRSGSPQFPSSLEWIANNQLEDGSWGYKDIYSAHDRIISTLACVVALKSWNLHPDKCDKGMKFFKENLNRLGDENIEHMPIGFEVAFPSVLEIARSLKLDVPDDCPVLHKIYDCRNLKLTKIPKDILHRVPTTLLHSMEGMAGLDWEKLLKLQCLDGSFLFSPASTAYGAQQTKDQKCILYLSRAVRKFNGGVPNVYPVDLFEHMWAVDRLQRLGLYRYFEAEIKECMNYVVKFWTEKGICWARNSEVQDIDDTAMGFRLLRLHGHKVSADVFKHFKKGDEFFCFAGQSNQAVTGMYNLYRASQVALPGENILYDAKEFSTKFLREKQASNELLDKWIIMKDLPGEVGYALDVPWYASLPRLETKVYIEQYGGGDDVWIGKTLYSMPYVNNNVYLELAKVDFNNCQALHLSEWDSLQKWYGEWKLGDYGLSKKSLLTAYFVAAASIFEPERANERLAWAKMASLVDTIESYFKGEPSHQDKKAFVDEFKNLSNMRDYEVARRSNKNKTAAQGIVGALLATLSQLSLDTMVLHGQDISQSLRQTWEQWLLKWLEKGGRHQDEAELLVETINQTAGLSLTRGLLSNTHPDHVELFSLTNKVCNQLRSCLNQKHKVNDNGNCGTKMNLTTQAIESDMQKLVELVLTSSDDMESLIKQSFFTVARSFYYLAYCDPKIISHHIDKVLFQRAI
ncbi:ent-copalyl diphosphate synthase 1-like isoform X2 [Argentina anserina]|uniref:ent-copalyl diphosphate synthase 1-like isoform X2 n=1 Tax=Argentina anserina TaxID=57926 RepID=UPI0021764696|nr:ent-copalyl diphosphate synthase 1-like isoform X2 [Potentilla anserina]